MKFFRGLTLGKILIILIALVFCLNFIIPAIINAKSKDPADPVGSGDAGTGETVYEIDKHAEWGDSMLNITMWDEDITSASSISQVASLAKGFGFTGVDYAINWYNIQKSLSGENMYDFSRVDSRLEAIAKQGMLACVSVFFTSMYYEKQLKFQDDLEWQETADGLVYAKENYGAAPCINHVPTRNAMVNAFEAFCTHIYEKFGTTICRVEARISQYGELEYFSSAHTALDYSEFAMQDFVKYLKNKHTTVTALCDAYQNTEFRSLTWEDIEWQLINSKTVFENGVRKTKGNNERITEAFDFDWQEFRQEEVMKLSKDFTDASHRASENADVTDKDGNRVYIPFAFQVGSVYDGAAYSLRGTYDPYLMGKNADIVHTDDAPLYNHNFSADFMMVDDSFNYASELDGYWHIQMMGEDVRQGYRGQAQAMGASGVKYLNTANWSYVSMFEERHLLRDYSELFFNSPARVYIGDIDPIHKKSAILINTADLLYKKMTAEHPDMIGKFYNEITQHGKYRIRFLTDTQLIENPSLLDEYTTLYLGGLPYNEYYVRTELYNLFKEKGTTLRPYYNAQTFDLKNEYGASISKSGLTIMA